jgi:hypothetical protein
MTQEEIIDMAIQAGMAEEIAAFNIPIVEAFAKLVASKATTKEREACAKVCDEFNFGQAAMMIQRAIRARGEA